MGLRTVGANGLSLALANAQPRNNGGAKKEHEKQRRHRRAHRAEGNIAEHIEEADITAIFGKHREHYAFPLAKRAFNAVTSGAMRLPSDPLIMTVSPGRTVSSKNGSRAEESAA